MEISLDVQREVTALPSDDELLSWLKETLEFEQYGDAELTIRFVNEEESAELNQQYRHKQGSTNILSFPFESPAEIDLNLLGDLVICSSIVEKQAVEQNKNELAHWAHMVVHGTLHLLGYDHLNDVDADVMETKEIKILSKLGYSDPYLDVSK